MIANPLSVHAKQQRLARHYLRVLQDADRTFRQGGENQVHAAQTIARERDQIIYWQAWAAAHAEGDPDAAALCSGFGCAAEVIGQLLLSTTEHLDWQMQGVAAARHIGDQAAEFEHLFILCQLHYVLNQLSAQVQCAQQALALAESLAQPYLQARALNLMAKAVHVKGQFAEAYAYYTRSLMVSRSLGDYKDNIDNLPNMAICLYSLGRLDEAQTVMKENLERVRRRGSLRDVAQSLIALGVYAQAQEDFNAAFAFLEEAMHIFEQLGDQRNFGYAMGTSALFAFAQEDDAAARTLWDRAIKIHRMVANNETLQRDLRWRAYLQVINGETEMAMRDGLESLELARSGSPTSLTLGLSMMSVICLHAQHQQAAQETLREAVDLAMQVESKVAHAEVLLATALLWWYSGYAQQAAEWIGLALGLGKVVWPPTRRHLQHYRAQLETALAPDVLAAALERGTSLDLAQVLAEIRAHPLLSE